MIQMSQWEDPSVPVYVCRREAKCLQKIGPVSLGCFVKASFPNIRQNQLI